MTIQETMRDITRKLRRDLDQEIERLLAEAMVAGMDLVVCERMDVKLADGEDATVTTALHSMLVPPRRYAPGERVPYVTEAPEGFVAGPKVTCRLFHSGGRELLLS